MLFCLLFVGGLFLLIALGLGIFGSLGWLVLLLVVDMLRCLCSVLLCVLF